jgi:bifunctional DNase/RNase
MRGKQQMKQAEIWSVCPDSLDEMDDDSLFLKIIDDDIIIPIFIERAETKMLIKAAHENSAAAARVSMYTTLLSLMEQAGYSCLGAEIYELRKFITRARVVFAGGDPAREPITAEASPVEACILAILAKAPLYVSDAVIKKIGLSPQLHIDKFLE